MNRSTGNPTVNDSGNALSDRERRCLLIEYNDSAAAYPVDETVVELFEAQVARTPDDEAVRLGEQSMSYAQLNERANQMAAHLRMLGAGPEKLVALYMEHSIEAVCAILGVLKAGAAYVPVDPASTPTERLAFILKDVSRGPAARGALPMLITQSRLLNRVPADSAKVVTLDSDFAGIEKYPSSNPPPAASPHNSAYVIYTSGSTGTPKGVLIECRSLVNYICWANQKYCQGERLTWPLFSSLAFDLTVTSIFTPLISGGRIVVYREAPAMHGTAIFKVIEDGMAEIVKLTPSHLSMIKNSDLSATKIRKLIVGGENFKTELARDITRTFGRPVDIYNEYGPTEATVGCMIHRYNADNDCAPSVPIGIPAANAGVYVLDEHLKPVPAGVTGEMYLAGDGLARGYLNRPELTEQKFLMAEDPRQDVPPNPSLFFQPHTLRLYKTGDLARWSADHRLEFLGRADYQVKIGGMRIEMGEIEAQLMAHPGIRECVVDVIRPVEAKSPMETTDSGSQSEAMQGPEDGFYDAQVNAVIARVGATEPPPTDETDIDRLVAYYVSEEPLTVAELRSHLANTLPDYMVPPYVMRLEKIPLTPNGKIDRKSLPVPANEHMQPPDNFVPPQTETEKALSVIWAELLKVGNVGINDDFFDLGGHSLLAIRAMSRIRDMFGVDIPLQALFENPTIAGIATVVSTAKGLETVPLTEQHNPSATTPVAAPRNDADKQWAVWQHSRTGSASQLPLIGLHGVDNIFGPITHHLATEIPFHILTSRAGFDGSVPPYYPCRTVEEMAERYLEYLRSFRPRGPYFLMGFCLGGLIAYEVAQRLTAAGEDVPFLGLFNPAPVAKSTHSEAFAKRLRLRFDALTQLDLRNQLDYVRTKIASTASAYAAHTLQAAARLKKETPPRAELFPDGDNGSLTPELIIKQIAAFGADMASRYSPLPYKGKVWLYYGEREAPGFRDRWARLAMGGIESYLLPGDHLTMMEEPHVRQVAAKLNASLEKNFSSLFDFVGNRL